MDEKIRELLRSYNVLSTIPSTGLFNVVTEIRNLEETPYFSGKPELISQMIMARSNQDIDALKTIIDAAIEEAENVGKIDIDAIEKEKGFKLPDEQREALQTAVQSVNTGQDYQALTDRQRALIIDDIVNQAFEIAPESGTRLIKDAEGQLQVFGGYFNNVLFSNIFSQSATTQEIVSFQNYLIENDIATPEDFAGTKGVYSETLRQKIESVMDWADQNINAAKGTPLRNQIEQEEALFFAGIEYENMDVSFERNLFNYAVKEIAKANVDLKKFELEKELEAEKIKYLPPRKETLDDMVEAYFVANTGRSPSAKELSDWSTKLAETYSEPWTQLQRFKYEKEFMDITTKPIYNTKFTVDPVTEKPRRVDTVTGQRLDFGNLQEMQPMTVEEIFEAKFEKEFGGEMEAWERGSQIKEMQNNIMSAMYGG
jgi:DNA-binding transcriptional regulator GbsR (MarR family)